MANKRFFTIRFLTVLFCLLLLAVKNPLCAQDFKQTLQWSKDPNVLEYKVEIQTSSGKAVTTLTTEENTISLSLKEGSYRYRITAYDFLGREAVSTGWNNFEVAIAKQPEIKHQKNMESLGEDGKSLEMDVEVDDVTSDTKAELVNVDNNARIPGKLILSSSAGAAASGFSASETHAASKVRFVDVPEGNWKLVITNPSGLSSESPVFEVKDTIKEEKLAAAKAEEERKERERLEAEQKAKEEAERLAREEEQRLAIEKAEREEQERIAREQAEREELARQIREAEEAERAREEAERLALEQAQREEEERLAREEAEAAEKEEKKKQRREAWLNYDRKFYLVAGAGMAMPLYDNGFFDEFMKKELFNMGFTGQIGYLPIHTDKLRFGMELNGLYTQFKNENDFYGLKLSTLIIQDNLALRFKIKTNKVWLQVKAGGGIALVNEILDYYKDGEDNKKDKTLSFGYFTAGGGLSVIFIPARLFVIEAGADFYNLFIPDANIGLLNPYIGIGIRF